MRLPIRGSTVVFLLLTAACSTGVEQGSQPANTAEGGSKERVSSLLEVESDALPDGWRAPGSMTHVTNYLVHEWYQNLTAAEGEEAKRFGIDFSINDANLDLQKSLAALNDAVSQGVDTVAFTPVDEKASIPAVRNARQRVPIVCESSPVGDECMTLVSIDDFDAGLKEGKWVGNYLKKQQTTKVKVLDIGLPALSTTVARSKGFEKGLESIIGDVEFVHVDGKGLKDEAVKVATDALTGNPDINVIFGINDDSALGGLQAYRAQGLDESKLLVAGFGCEGEACKKALESGGPYKVSAAMFPEFQGAMLARAAIAAYNDQDLPVHTVMPSTPVDVKTLNRYYAKSGSEYDLNFDAVAKLFEADR